MITWQKTSHTTLESVPARYVIRSHQYGYQKSYEAHDTLLNGVLGARRGIHNRQLEKMRMALAELKQEVEEYDQRFG